MRLLDWLLLQFPLTIFQLIAVGLIAVVGMVMVRLIRRRRSKAVRAGRLSDPVAARARQLMDDSDVELLNLLSLVAHDHFLVLAKLPLRSLFRVRVRDASDTRVVAHAIGGITVDFVLIHPGTRRAVKAIFVGKSWDDSAASPWREPWVDDLFLDAEIDVIRLDRDARYSVEQLTALLGLE